MHKTYAFILTLALLPLFTFAQNAMPEWFVKDMEANIGEWVADNSAFKSDEEPFTHYGMEWKWGIGKSSITAELYGLVDGEKSGTFWEFRQYWDFAKKQGIVIQYGAWGDIGTGPIRYKGDGKTEMVQTFTSAKGESKLVGHRSEMMEDMFISTSFAIDPKGNWTPDRTYEFKKVNNTDAAPKEEEVGEGSSTPEYDPVLAKKYGADEYGMSKYVIAFLKAGPNRSADSTARAELQKAHMANIGRMAKEGQLVLAGPFLDGGELRGIYVFDVETIEEARELTATDPAIKAGTLVMELHPWYGSAGTKAIGEIHEKMQKTKF